jgi:glycosyltransferase involved in cell wall biosynthesis
MKILHVIGGLGNGGAEVMLEKTLVAMGRQGVDSSVVSLSDIGPIGRSLVDQDVPVKSLGLSRTGPNPAGVLRLARWLRQDPPDVIHSWMYHGNLISALARFFTKRIPLVWGIRCSNTRFAHYNPLGRFSFHLNAGLSCLPDAILYNSEAGRSFHARYGFSARRTAVIRNGFDTDRFRPDPKAYSDVRRELGLADRTLIIGMIGRFDPAKDHRTFLEAASSAGPEGEVHFVLAGDGVDQGNASLRRWISDGRLGGRISLLGERDDIPQLMAAMDLLVCSSAFGEGFPNVVGEAMACQVPCVVTDVGDCGHVVADSGVVVPAGSPADLARAITTLLSKPAEDLKDLGRRARIRVQEHFDISQVAARMAALFRDVMDGKRKSCAA